MALIAYAARRLPALDDRQAVGATMNLTDGQSTYLVTLPPGTAAVFTDGMDYPVLARMPDGTAREAAPATPGTPVRLVGRSATCGAECARQPCDLTEIETARQLPGDPALSWWRLWAELCVVAHLTGWTAPRPRADLLATARALPRRSLDCAVGAPCRRRGRRPVGGHHAFGQPRGVGRARRADHARPPGPGHAVRPGGAGVASAAVPLVPGVG